MEDLKIEDKILKVILFIAGIVSLFITFYIGLGIDNYSKYFILPALTIITGFTILVNCIDVKINKKAYIYLIYIGLIVCSNLIVPLADVNKYLNVIVVPILTSIYIFRLINPNYKINLNFIRWFYKLFPNYLFSNLEYVEDATKSIKLGNNKGKDILKGILIAIPILIVLTLLLTSADMYFSSFISKILGVFRFNLDIGNIIKHVIILVLSFIGVFSVSINIYQYRKSKIDDNKEIFVSDIISYIILGFVNLIYVLFLISEISKLTTNFLNIPVEYTYAKYAREGFFQLLGVSSINFAIIIFYYNYVKDFKDKKWIKYLLLTIICFSIFIIFNSYYRMGLYIFEYGFTILRLQVILFLTMELIFFVILIFKLNNKMKKDKSLKYLIIMLVTYFLNIYLCNDIVINFINELWFRYVLK